jgi:hypothetical protein
MPVRHARHAAELSRAAPSSSVASRRGLEAGVLRLQRLAGNRAVCQLLQRQPAPLLGGLDAATRKKIQVATTNVTDMDDEETFARAAPKELKDVTIRFGAKVPADTTLRTGLQVIAWDMFDPKGHKPDMDSPFRNNSTVTLELDLKPFKGENGLWQFTYATTGTPPQRQLLIDYVGPAPNYDPPDNAATRFSELGLKLKPGTAGPFGGKDKDAIYTAVSLLPAAAAAKLPRGITFVRDQVPNASGGSCTPPPANSAGVYCSADQTITLFDRWLNASQVRYARTNSKVATVLHELGHAIDHANPDAHAAFARALTSDGGTAISGYGNKNTLESYAECFFLYIADPKMLESLRPSVYAYFEGAYGGTAAPAAPAGAGAGSGAGSGAAPRPAPVRTGAGSGSGSGSGSAARH